MLASQSFDKLFVGGKWLASSANDRFEIRSPHDGSAVGHTPAATKEDMDLAVATARQAFDEGPWPQMSVSDRVAIIRRFADLYASKVDAINEFTVREMGTPVWVFRISAGKPQSLLALDYLIKLSEQFVVEEHCEGQICPNGIIIRHEPIGVVGAIVPWNAPQVIMLAKIIPALIAGCTVVVKPSPEAPIDPMMVCDLFVEAGMPDGVLSILPAGPEVGEHLVTHPEIDKITFTGSSAVGRRIAELCGRALKRVSLELGGKSAAIILDDANLETAIPFLRYCSLANSGQGCVLQTRILASRKRYDEVVDAVTAMVGRLTVGDPSDPEMVIGPMISARQKARIESYIESGIAEGARITVGGLGTPDGLEGGHYVRPTVFADVTNDMRIAREEIFGPVLVVIPYDDEDDAVRIANDSEYGLAGSVWTEDTERGLAIARRIRAGTYGVNCYAMDFAGPFGGYKASGLGREFGPDIFKEFSEAKTIVPPIFTSDGKRAWGVE